MSRIPVHPIAARPDSDLGADSNTAPFYPLGCLTAYARSHRGGLLEESFDIRPTRPARASSALEATGLAAGTPGVFLFSSFVWNHSENLALARAVRERSPDSLVVFGGPHVPSRPGEVRELFSRHPEIDLVARGEGEITVAEILEVVAAAGAPGRLGGLDYSGVDGLAFLDSQGEIFQVPPRQRTRRLDLFPSPYLSGEFDAWIEGTDYAFIETNRGCPYQCVFCDWGAATLNTVNKMSLDRVLAEIEFLAERSVEGVMICDANFGLLPRDLEVAEHLVRMNEKYGFPRDVAYANTKTVNQSFREIVKLLRRAGLIKAGQVSVQTVDPDVLATAKRSNISVAEYDRVIRLFHNEGIPVNSDMMIGLAGQTLETTKTDLQFFFDRLVTTTIHATTVMPNAPLAAPEYLAEHEVVVDDEYFIESTASFSAEEYRRMQDLCYTYKFFVSASIAKYILYFMQQDYSVPAVDFLLRWRQVAHRYPISSRVKATLLDRDYDARQKHFNLDNIRAQVA